MREDDVGTFGGGHQSCSGRHLTLEILLKAIGDDGERLVRLLFLGGVGIICIGQLGDLCDSCSSCSLLLLNAVSAIRTILSLLGQEGHWLLLVGRKVLGVGLVKDVECIFP
jgi:hypothetical protein